MFIISFIQESHVGVRWNGFEKGVPQCLKCCCIERVHGVLKDSEFLPKAQNNIAMKRKAGIRGYWWEWSTKTYDRVLDGS